MAYPRAGRPPPSGAFPPMSGVPLPSVDSNLLNRGPLLRIQNSGKFNERAWERKRHLKSQHERPIRRTAINWAELTSDGRGFFSLYGRNSMMVAIINIAYLAVFVASVIRNHLLVPRRPFWRSSILAGLLPKYDMANRDQFLPNDSAHFPFQSWFLACRIDGWMPRWTVQVLWKYEECDLLFYNTESAFGCNPERPAAAWILSVKSFQRVCHRGGKSSISSSKQCERARCGVFRSIVVLNDPVWECGWRPGARFLLLFVPHCPRMSGGTVFNWGTLAGVGQSEWHPGLETLVLTGSCWFGER